MKRIRCYLYAAVLAIPLVASAWAQEVVHGADSQFSRPDLKLGWAVDRGASEDKATVVIRLLNVAGAFKAVRVDGVDPFTKDRIVLVEVRPLTASADLSILRSKFADYPSAEIHLFTSEDATLANKPALTVFYLGVPDTTPELPTADGVRAYLDRMVKP